MINFSSFQFTLYWLLCLRGLNSWPALWLWCYYYLVLTCLCVLVAADRWRAGQDHSVVLCVVSAAVRGAPHPPLRQWSQATAAHVPDGRDAGRYTPHLHLQSSPQDQAPSTYDHVRLTRSPCVFETAYLLKLRPSSSFFNWLCTRIPPCKPWDPIFLGIIIWIIFKTTQMFSYKATIILYTLIMRCTIYFCCLFYSLKYIINKYFISLGNVLVQNKNLHLVWYYSSSFNKILAMTRK